MLVDENEMGLDLGFAFLEDGLNIGQLAPAGSLAVGDHVNLLPNRHAAFEVIDRFVERRKKIGGAVAQPSFANRFASQIQIESRQRNDLLHDVRRQPDRRGRACRHGIEHLLAGPASLVQARLGPVTHPHAVGVIDDDNAGHF